MKIGICIKAVMNTEAELSVNEAGELITSDESLIVNPFDEYAIEEAIKIKSQMENVETVVLSVGGEEIDVVLRSALAMGVDRAIRIAADRSLYYDSLKVAKACAEKLSQLNPDILLLGHHTVDDNDAQLGPMMAGRLNWSQVTNVIQLTVEENSLTAVRKSDHGQLIYLRCQMPAVVTVTKGINIPRIPNLRGIMAARKKEIEVFEPSIRYESGLTSRSYDQPVRRKSCRFLEGDIGYSVRELIRILREEEKVI